MIKNYIRSLAQKFGYDFVKTNDFHHGKRFKKNSDDSRYDYYETPRGNYYLPKTSIGDVVAVAMKTGELFDSEIYEAAKAFIKPNSIVLDIGANYGQMAIEFSKVAENTKLTQKALIEITKKIQDLRM